MSAVVIFYEVSGCRPFAVMRCKRPIALVCPTSILESMAFIGRAHEVHLIQQALANKKYGQLIRPSQSD